MTSPFLHHYSQPSEFDLAKVCRRSGASLLTNNPLVRILKKAIRLLPVYRLAGGTVQLVFER